MKNIGWLGNLFLVLWMCVPQTCSGQAPPPNDYYSNSIALSGTDVTFSGTLAHATVENFREQSSAENVYVFSTPNESVWWNWTAPLTTTLNLQILGSSPQTVQIQTLDDLIVYTATDGSTSPDDLKLPALGVELLDFRLSPQTLSIPVTAGSNYLIQLIGSSSASYTFRLIATNAPVIVAQPRSQTVYSNASALFYVMTAGTAPLSFAYQWCFNGSNLTNQTNYMLALTNIDGTMAGQYSVSISNAAGYALSQPATLSVSQSNFPVSLAALGIISNNLMFSLTGEIGRLYRIESSTDLVHWAPEVGFPIGPVLPNTTSVIFNSNSSTVLAVTNNAARKFVRARPYVIGNSIAEICINNLRQVRLGKLYWQRDFTQNSPINQPLGNWLLPFLPNMKGPFCPDDFTDSLSTSYNPRNLVQTPACNLNPDHTHVLEDPL